MKINWKVRFRNPYFWIGLIAVVLTAVGISPETFTSWAVLAEQVKELLSNPYAVGCTVIALIGYITDPTTKGITDSAQALTYSRPKAEK